MLQLPVGFLSRVGHNGSTFGRINSFDQLSVALTVLQGDWYGRSTMTGMVPYTWMETHSLATDSIDMGTPMNLRRFSEASCPKRCSQKHHGNRKSKKNDCAFSTS